MKYARVPHPGNVVVEVFDEPPEFHADVMATIHEAPDEVEVGWTYQGGNYAPPEPPPPPALKDVQDGKIVEVETLFDIHAEIGFLFEGNRFAMTDHGTRKQDLIRRSEPGATPQVLNTSGVLIPIPPNKRNAWLTAGDAALSNLYNVRDGHIAGIRATTTPEEAAAYDVTTGWPT